MKKIQILELFSGYASWSNPFIQDNQDIITLDYDCKFKPTICQDILKWNYKESNLKPDVIFASPDCTYFSKARASLGYPEDKIQWTKSLWEKTYEIISYFNPEYYLIENPIGKARKYYPNYHSIDYCMYGYIIYGAYIKKPTDLWTNIEIPFKRCDKKHYHGQLMDIVRNKAIRAKIPKGLVLDIREFIYKNI